MLFYRGGIYNARAWLMALLINLSVYPRGLLTEEWVGWRRLGLSNPDLIAYSYYWNRASSSTSLHRGMGAGRGCYCFHSSDTATASDNDFLFLLLPPPAPLFITTSPCCCVVAYSLILFCLFVWFSKMANTTGFRALPFILNGCQLIIY